MTCPAWVPSPASPLSRALQSARIRSVLSIAAKSSGPTGTSPEERARSSASVRVNRARKTCTSDCWIAAVVLLFFWRRRANKKHGLFAPHLLLRMPEKGRVKKLTVVRASLGRVRGDISFPSWRGPARPGLGHSRHSWRRDAIEACSASVENESVVSSRMQKKGVSTLTRERGLASLTSEKARRNSLLPCSILASTSFLKPPLLKASEIPAPPCSPVVVVVVGSDDEAAVLARFDSASWTCPRVSSAARVAPSSRLAESRRVTLAWRGFRVEVVELLLVVGVAGGIARPARAGAGSGSSAGILSTGLHSSRAVRRGWSEKENSSFRRSNVYRERFFAVQVAKEWTPRRLCRNAQKGTRTVRSEKSRTLSRCEVGGLQRSCEIKTQKRRARAVG